VKSEQKVMFQLASVFPSSAPIYKYIEKSFSKNILLSDMPSALGPVKIVPPCCHNIIIISVVNRKLRRESK